MPTHFKLVGVVYLKKGIRHAHFAVIVLLVSLPYLSNVYGGIQIVISRVFFGRVASYTTLARNVFVAFGCV
jgi:hypothetical protein